MINRQQHAFSCGPTVITNVLEWLGMRTPYEKILAYCKKNKTYDNCMYRHQLIQNLQELGIKHRIIPNATIKDMKQEIDRGNAVIYLYAWMYKGNEGAHYVFIDDYTPKFMRAWNSSIRNKTPWRTNRILSEFIRYSNRKYKQVYGSAIVIPKY